MGEKLLTNAKFLLEVRKLALSHMLDHVPQNDAELYQPYLWTKGVIMALRSRGYIITKEKLCICMNCCGTKTHEQE